MKRKLLSLTAALLCAVGMWADSVDKMSNAQGDWTGATGIYDGVAPERYNGNDTPFSIGDVLYQTITGLSDGYYQISFYAWENFSDWNPEASIGYGVNIAEVFANTSVQGIDVIKSKGNRGWDASNTYTLLATVTDGTLKYGVKNIAAGGNWAVCRAISLTYLGTCDTYFGASDKADCTSLILNPSFETGNMSGWTTLHEGNVVNPGTLSDCGVKPVASYPLSNSDGEYIMNYFGWSWSCDPVNGIRQTIPDLPAGTYRIEAVLGGWAPTTAEGFSEPAPWEMVLNVNDEEQQVKEMVTDNAGVPFSVDITLDSATDLTITAKTYHKGQNKWEACFMKADNFRLYNLNHYYDALNVAISAAEGNTLGFDVGEYAPYNNVAAITALNAAKAVNQANYDISWADLETIVSNLTSAIWTPNVGEVNAIYDGTFSNAPVADATGGVNGWSAATGLRQLVKSDVEGSIVTTGMYVWGSNAVTYGETTGYTLPMAAETVYKLTYNRASWDGGSSRHTDITITDPSGAVLGTAIEEGYAGDWNKTEGTLLSRSIYFVTTTAGDYKLSIGPWGNTVYTNMVLKKTSDDLTFADGSIPSFVPGTYPTVKISRTLTVNRWATAVYPFAVSGVDNIAVLDSYNASTGAIGFTTADHSTANVPFLMRSTTAKSEISLSNVAVAAVNPTDAIAGKASLKGAYTDTNITNAQKNYVLSNNQIFSVGDAGATIKPYRAYIQIDQSSPVKALNFFIDGDEATGIVSPLGETEEGAAIYNVAGQRMNKMQKGINIVNGKKILF